MVEQELNGGIKGGSEAGSTTTSPGYAAKTF